MVNKHIHHLEDLPFLEGEKGAKLIGNMVDSLARGDYRGFTKKIDGSPSIFFGYFCNQFFVATKSILNKIPQIFTCHAELLKIPDKELRAKMHAALVNLKHLPIDKNKVYQCDLLFYNEDTKHHLTGSDGPVVRFKPNTIGYSVCDTSRHYNAICDAAIGVAIHTVYRKKEGEVLGLEMTNETPRFSSCGWYVFVMPIEIDHDKPVDFEINLYPSKHLDWALCKMGNKKIAETFRKLITQYLHKHPYPSAAGLGRFILNWHDEKINSLKMNHAKDKQMSVMREMMTVYCALDHNALFNMHRHCLILKNYLYDMFEREEEFFHTIRWGGEYVSASPEGYVWKNKNGSMLKIVDRKSFTMWNNVNHGR